MTNKYEIKLSTGNSAFDENEGAEVARILRKLADNLEMNYVPKNLVDINGNKVGTLTIKELD